MLSDLIVLGLPYSSTEEDVKTYFEKYGELAHCEVCNLFVYVSVCIKILQATVFLLNLCIWCYLFINYLEI